MYRVTFAVHFCHLCDLMLTECEPVRRYLHVSVYVILCVTHFDFYFCELLLLLLPPFLFFSSLISTTNDDSKNEWAAMKSSNKIKNVHGQRAAGSSHTHTRARVHRTKIKHQYWCALLRATRHMDISTPNTTIVDSKWCSASVRFNFDKRLTIPLRI